MMKERIVESFHSLRTGNKPTRMQIVKWLLVGGGIVIIIAIYKTLKKIKVIQAKPKAIKNSNIDTSKAKTLKDNEYDVAIVGAGASGSTAAYYLAQYGYKVLLLEQKHFPRERIGGNTITPKSQKHLKEMGVIEELVKENKVKILETIGMNGPFGHCAQTKVGKQENQMISVKRVHLDEKIARAAERKGAHLKEGHDVIKVSRNFVGHKGWAIVANHTPLNTEETKQVKFFATVLICADGSLSKTATSLKLVTDEPQAVVSNIYIQEHNFQTDAITIYQRQLLPGYCTINKYADGDISLSTYIIPGGKTKKEDLAKVHENNITKDSFITSAIGTKATIEEMNTTYLRVGGIEKSFADNVLVIGSAAGMLNPLTGEGIHYSLDSAKIAADVVGEALRIGDVTKNKLKQYQDIWEYNFGSDFYLSALLSKLIAKHPVLIGAITSLANKKGEKFLTGYNNATIGGRSKAWFITPTVAFSILLEIIKLSVFRK
ncbi:hypothetical protein ABK040_013703 [Willaertia magna]